MTWHPTYSEHPAIGYTAAVLDNMRARTGRSMEDWVALALAKGPSGEKACREWLRQEFDLGMTTASGIATFAHGDGGLWANSAAYLKAAPVFVDEAYAGKKAHLRPIHDAVVRMALTLGPEVRFCPTRTGVSLYRTKVFANLRPATQKRVDLGLCLRDGPPPQNPRVVDTGGAKKGDRITHRVGLTAQSEVDDDVKVLLLRAFESDV